MFKVLMLNEDEFVIVRDMTAQYGNADKTVRNLHKMGVDINEIEYGLMTMIHRGHNVAEYGVNKTFIFSKRISIDSPGRDDERGRYSSYKDAVSDFKRGFIWRAVEECNGNKSNAIRLFGIPSTLIWKRSNKSV